METADLLGDILHICLLSAPDIILLQDEKTTSRGCTKIYGIKLETRKKVKFLRSQGFYVRTGHSSFSFIQFKYFFETKNAPVPKNLKCWWFHSSKLIEMTFSKKMKHLPNLNRRHFFLKINDLVIRQFSVLISSDLLNFVFQNTIL